MSNPFDIFADDNFEAVETTGAVAPVSYRGQLKTASDAMRYILAGKSTVTLKSVKTDKHFTYRVSVAKDSDTFFVGLLVGDNNETDYKYLGRISRGLFWAGRKNLRPGDISPDAPSAIAFMWAWKCLCRDHLPDTLEIWQEGRCGRCGLKLTRPESVNQGFGPECINKIGF